MEKIRHQEIASQLDKLVESAYPGTFSLKLQILSRRLLNQGYSREQLLAHYEEYRSVLQAQGLEEQEDDLLDVMDRLDGWVSPHARI